MNELRSYIISKMLWNPECDIDKHIKEFVDFFYGKAATPQILAYINALCDKVEKDSIQVGYNDNTNAEYLTDEMLEVYNSHLDKAIEAVKDDPVRYFRVSKIKLSTRWIKIKNDAMLKGIQDKDEINRFYTDWKAFGISRIDEWVSPQTTHKALVRDTWRGIDFYRHWADEGSEFY